MGGSSKRHRGRRLGFLSHELAEYALAVALIAIGVHLHGGTSVELLAIGSAVALVNILTDAPLGAFNVFSRRAHRSVDLLLALAIALAPLVERRHVGVVGTLLLEATAAVYLLILASTNYLGPARRERRSFLRSPNEPQPLTQDPGLPSLARGVGHLLGASRRLARELSESHDQNRS